MRKTALIIMPVGSDPDYRIKESAISRAVHDAGLQPIFPLYEPVDPRFISSGFREQLLQSDIVLADLTGERPSCYYELGFAEALERPVKLFAQLGTPIHQSSYRGAVSFYGHPDQLANAIREVLSAEALE